MSGACNTAEIERLLFHWPSVIGQARTEWASGFAASIAKQSRRKGWRPTDRQLGMMRRMVSDLFSQSGRHDMPVIEEEA